VGFFLEERMLFLGLHNINKKHKIYFMGTFKWGRDKGRMRIRMRMADADEKIRMGKCGWGIKRGWENDNNNNK
jgi:hypothetical protein